MMFSLVGAQHAAPVFYRDAKRIVIPAKLVPAKAGSGERESRIIKVATQPILGILFSSQSSSERQQNSGIG